MKLIYRIFLRLSLALSLILSVWAVFFYITVMTEINDEMNDSLAKYTEQVIDRFLAGDETLEISAPTIEKEDVKQAILYLVFFLYAGLLVVILIVNVGVYHHSNRPLYKLLEWLEQYRIGKKNEPLINETQITEFKKLNKVILRSMERAEEVFEQQKQFIGDVSHEMQTPLAVCRNRIENLMQDEKLTEDQLNELTQTYSTLEYMTKLNQSLLLLTKIDNRQFTDTIPLVFNEVIGKRVPDYEEVYGWMHIHTQINEKGVFMMQMHEMLAHILVNNLLKNAYVHNIENGVCQIEISSTRIIFRNTGQNTPLHPDHIFERFYKGHNKAGSMGLGLVLVKSIAELQKLNIRYYFEHSMHCFEISEMV